MNVNYPASPWALECTLSACVLDSNKAAGLKYISALRILPEVPCTLGLTRRRQGLDLERIRSPRRVRALSAHLCSEPFGRLDVAAPQGRS